MRYTRAGQLIGVSDEAHVGGQIFSGGYRSALDRFGRTTAVTAGYGGGDRVMAAAYSYNPVGLLSSISLPGLCEERAYNLRGQPAAISSPVYEEILRYEDGIQTPTVTGRTSEREFRLYGDLRRSYHYSYDGLGRLAMANSHDEQAHSWGRFALEREFDLNSNIVRLTRSGVFARGVYDMVDNISIGYDGNQLCSLREDAETVPLESSLDIPMADCADSSFGYDACGNLTSDPSRGITHIEYSPAGRPLRISLADGSGIEYVHDADGTRLEEIVSKPEYIKTRHSYRGAFEFEDDAPVRYNVPTGYFDSDGTLYSYTKDFQGNVVAVTSADTAGSFNIHQLTAYYPDGMPYPQEALINSGVKPVLPLGRSNRYKYSAKELTTSGGANFYDFEARNLAIGLGIFDSPDRKAADYPSLSPYSYCAADPVNFVDPTGEAWYSLLNKDNGEFEIHYTEIQSVEEFEKSGIEGTYEGEIVVVFNGSINESLSKDGKIYGEGAVIATATVYGADGPDDIFSYDAFTMSSNFEKFGAIADGRYNVYYKKRGKGGKLSSNYAVNDGMPVDCINGTNPSPSAYSPFSKTQKNGIYIHSTNRDGTACDWPKRNIAVSTGCLLISAKDWPKFMKQIGENNFIMYLKRRK